LCGSCQIRLHLQQHGTSAVGNQHQLLVVLNSSTLARRVQAVLMHTAQSL
jgi:hypothetical protein